MAIIKQQAGELVYFTDEQIPVPHAFTTRLGGVSTGVYESLNLSLTLGDDPEPLFENYKRITAVLGTRPENLVCTRQVHEDNVRTVGAADCLGDIFQPIDEAADGLVTAEREVALAMFSADCIPILLWDAGTGAVGAVHAGWRSTVLDIAGIAVQKLESLGAKPQNIRAAIGPGIGPCCFETDPEVPEAVKALWGGEMPTCIRSLGGGKSAVDLKEVNRCLLLRAGLLPEHMTVSEYCTMCEPELFWSHRRSERVRGSQAAIILSRGNT